MSEPIAVLHLVDTLAAGGTERMAVNLVNHLPRDRWRPLLCTTRSEGPLAAEVAPDVGRLALGRRTTLDAAALLRLSAFNRRHQVQLLHAHSSSLFTAVLASLLPPFPRVLWHDHYGRQSVIARRAWPYRLLTRRTSAAIVVTRALGDWAVQQLQLPAERVHVVPNFVSPSAAGDALDLPGTPGSRIVCVANLRPEKDHPTLLRAMAQVVESHPTAHLIIVGAGDDTAWREGVLAEVEHLGIGQHVSWLGRRQDVAAILRSCDVAVLSSASEGLPLALLEYGAAGLAVVATDVGECRTVLDGGSAGVLVPPAEPAALATALLRLLSDHERRDITAARLRARVAAHYSPGAAVERVEGIYQAVLGGRSRQTRQVHQQ